MGTMHPLGLRPNIVPTEKFRTELWLNQQVKQLIGSESNDSKHEMCHGLFVTTDPDVIAAIIIF